MFCGTLRKNLDPFGQYGDAELWRALEEVHLKEKLTSSPETAEKGLEFEFAEGSLFCPIKNTLAFYNLYGL